MHWSIAGTVLSVLAVLSALSCGRDQEWDPGEYGYATPMRTIALVEPESLFVVRQVLGEMDGDLAFPYFTHIAVNDSLMAVVDEPACQIMLLHRETGKLGARLGRCGDGPAEFKYIGGLAFSDDSLIVVDQSSHSVAVLDFNGVELRRVRVSRTGLGEGVLALTSLNVLDDSTWIAGLRLPAREPLHRVCLMCDIS